MHLLRDTATVLLAAGGAALTTMALHCRWTHDTMRVAYTDKSPLCAIVAKAILAGHPREFAKQCFLGRQHVPVPQQFVAALLPGVFELQQQLQQQYQQATSKAAVDHSRLCLTDTLIMLAQSFLRALPFRLQSYGGGAYFMCQLPQVAAILSTSQRPAFQQQVLDSHLKYERQRSAPLAVVAPGLADRLDELVGSVQQLMGMVSGAAGGGPGAGTAAGAGPGAALGSSAGPGTSRCGAVPPC
jgi:hypothetical protein